MRASLCRSSRAGRYSALHVALSLLLIPLFLTHVGLRWPRPRQADLIGRRATLRLLILLAAGLVLWRVQEVFSAPPRFTGSREEASFADNLHPVTNWLADPIPHIEPDRWRLWVHGEVEREISLSYEQALYLRGSPREAVLDCTGGRYTVQRWDGFPVADLLERTGVREDARSLLFRSDTGYARRFPLNEAGDLLLATHVEGEVLLAGHGFPLRLVAPGHRGYNWVKWVAELGVSQEPAWLEPPLPLQ